MKEKDSYSLEDLQEIRSIICEAGYDVNNSLFKGLQCSPEEIGKIIDILSRANSDMINYLLEINGRRGGFNVKNFEGILILDRSVYEKLPENIRSIVKSRLEKKSKEGS